jgi:hypothetical protein
VYAVKVDLRMPDAVGNLFKTSLNEFATFCCRAQQDRRPTYR